MKTVILVPRREGFADRDRIWAWLKAWWSERHPKWPIFEGHHEASEGLFNRSAAVNRAAAQAGKWDVAVIIDADVICDVERTRKAVTMAHATGQMVLPYTERKDLSAEASEQVMAGYLGNWERPRWVTRRYRNQVSGVIAIPRRLWDAVEGFDEQFVGWGGEDNAFAVACETFGGPILRVEGDVWELFHAAAPEGRKGSPSHNANYARKRRYDAALGNQEAVRRLRHETVTFSDAGSGIPRILHRVVPERVNPLSESWWQRFAQLHPGWELKTWQDPIDPAPFPLTSPYWRFAKHGAQLADLVRLEALFNEGGVYVDADVEPLRPLDALLPLSAFAGWEDAKRVPNAVMGSVPGHPAIRECIDIAVERIQEPDKYDIPTATGPGVLTEVLPWRADVLLLPPGSLYPVHYRDARRMRDNPHGSDQPWAFVSHHWWGSWLPEKKRFNHPTELKWATA